jgi:hypothetical protein
MTGSLLVEDLDYGTKMDKVQNEIDFCKFSANFRFALF